MLFPIMHTNIRHAQVNKSYDHYKAGSLLYYCNLSIGNYFGSHFIMGGERFDTPQPESYLFGENSDLNFLGSRPTPVSENILMIWNQKQLYNLIVFMTCQGFIVRCLLHCNIN